VCELVMLDVLTTMGIHVLRQNKDFKKSNNYRYYTY